MPKQFDYRLVIKTSGTDTFTLGTVVASPRLCNPVDVQTACDSIEFADEAGSLPDGLRAFASYILTDWFALAHRTGLYNRQMNLWSALARVTEVQFVRLKQGLFTKVYAPYTDVHFLDIRGYTVLFGTLAQPIAATTPRKLEKELAKVLKEAMRRASPIQQQHERLRGIFLAFSGAIPEHILQMASKITNASDTVALYESLLPAPLSVPLNILSINANAFPNLNPKSCVSHIYPPLRAAKEVTTANIGTN